LRYNKDPVFCSRRALQFRRI